MQDALEQTGYRVSLGFVSVTRCGGDRQTYMATPPLPVAVPVTDGTVTLLGGSASDARTKLTAQTTGDVFGVKSVDSKMTVEETQSSNN